MARIEGNMFEVSDTEFMLALAWQGQMAENIELAKEFGKALESYAEALAVERAIVAGLEAQLELIKESHPDILLFKNSALKFKDGTPKTFGRIVYEEAFDRRLKQINPEANPLKYRKD